VRIAPIATLPSATVSQRRLPGRVWLGLLLPPVLLCRADACPGGEVGPGREAAHIGADLCDDHFGGAVSTPWRESSNSTSAR
jgi:hypothetical protein